MFDDLAIGTYPPALEAILVDTGEIGFAMASENRTCALLRVLAASKPSGKLLELGTGTGIGTAWLLDGMDAGATLDSVDSDPEVQGIARHHLGHDSRVTFHLSDGADFLAWASPRARTFDMVFADTWAGKFTHLNEALALVAVGGFYVIDDLLPQANWPDGHAEKVDRIVVEMMRHSDFRPVKLAWSTGVLLLVRSRA